MSNITIITICLAIFSICGMICGCALVVSTIMEGKKMDWADDWMGEWIDVKKEEPQEDEAYLISWYGYLLDAKTRSYVEIAEYDGAEWLVDHIEKRGYKNVVVTAWMPLPEPYKPESEDKCKKCKYSRNPDYTRCHKCKAESEG